MRTKTHSQEYSHIRVLATLLVIIGHSTNFGFGQGDAFAGKSIKMIMDALQHAIYSFHMPLFVMLSGTVFVNNKHSLIPLIKRKARRLLVPYLTCAVLIWIPVRLLVGYYGIAPNIGRIFLQDVILGKDINFLWYLIMLFETTIIIAMFCGYDCEKFRNWKKRKQILFALALLIVSVASYQITYLPFQIHRTMELLIWFYAGLLFGIYKDRLKMLGIKKNAVLLTVGWLLTELIYYLLCRDHFGVGIILKLFKLMMRYIVAGLGCAMCYSIAFCFASHQNMLLKTIERHSYLIYLLHVPCMYLFCYMVSNIVDITMCSKSIYLLLLIAKAVVGVIVPILIGTVVHKIKNGKGI